MKLSEYLTKYTEENAMIDLKPELLNQKGNLPIKIVFGKTIVPIQVAQENVKPLDKKGENYSVKLSAEAIKQIQIAISKEKGNDPQFQKMSMALNSFINKTITVYLNKVEIIYNSDTGVLNFR